MRLRSYALSVILFFSLLAAFATWQMSRYHAAEPEIRYRSANPQILTSNGVTADYQIAQELNRMPGVNGCSVLIKDGVAYVGAHGIGNEAKILEIEEKSKDKQSDLAESFVKTQRDLRERDAKRSERSVYSGKGTAEQLARNNRKHGTWRPDNEKAPANAASAAGNLDPLLQRQIEKRVQSMNRNIRKVYITSDVEHAAKLQEYARHIHSGASITSFQGDFSSTIKQIWPDAAP